MLRLGFEPKIPAFERMKVVDTSDLMATVTRGENFTLPFTYL
jgi:hypothetical protein